MTEQAENKTVLDREMPAKVGHVLGKIGLKTWLDLMVMVAGIWCLIIIIMEMVFIGIGVGTATNGWKVGYYIICLWVYADTALFIKLGPFFASKFKNVSGAFSFLRDENDAKNFVVIIGGWTAALDTLMSAITSGGSYWVIVAYLAPLAVFGLFLLKGPLARLVGRARGGKAAVAEKKPAEKVVKTEPKPATKVAAVAAPAPKAEPAPAPAAEAETPAPAPKPATKPAKKTTKRPAKKTAA